MGAAYVWRCDWEGCTTKVEKSVTDYWPGLPDYWWRVTVDGRDGEALLCAHHVNELDRLLPCFRKLASFVPPEPRTWVAS